MANIKKVAPFLTKTYAILEKYPNEIQWTPAGDSFIIKDPVEFSQKILPQCMTLLNFVLS